MNEKAKHREYLNQKVNFLMKPLLVAILKKKPENVTDFVIRWCEVEGRSIEKKYEGNVAKPKNVPKIPSKKVFDEDFEDIEKVERSLNNLDKNKAEEKDSLDRKDTMSSRQLTESSNSENDDVLDLEELKAKKGKKKKKMGISAEVYGEYNKPGDFKAKVIKKTDAQKQMIKEILLKSFMFRALEKNDQTIVIDAMDIKSYKPEEKVIKQGDDGQDLYIVSSGELKCTKIFSGSTDETFLKNYYSGEVFGELSLLYNTPRAASITATKDSVLFSLDRNTFNHIVKNAAIKRRDKYDDFLKQIDILKELDSYERGKLCDALKREEYLQGDYIIREGEAGSKFFLILSGEAVALKGPDEKQVFEYKEHEGNQYFGELALLNGDMRKASIKVTSETMIVASLSKKTFKRILGSIESILMRNKEKYKKYVQGK